MVALKRAREWNISGCFGLFIADTLFRVALSEFVMASSSTLIYLGLAPDYRPSPQDEPLEFLTKHIREIPPHLFSYFSQCTTPKQRTTIPLIRNRRLKYIESSPGEFKFESARNTWAALWEGQDHRVLFKQSGEEEKAWAKREFMSGSTQHVGKLGDLLAGYEEERQAEHLRDIRRAIPREDHFIPEEDDDDSEDDLPPEIETPAQAQSSFLRMLKERFIYGLLEVSSFHACGHDHHTRHAGSQLRCCGLEREVGCR